MMVRFIEGLLRSIRFRRRWGDLAAAAEAAADGATADLDRRVRGRGRRRWPEAPPSVEHHPAAPRVPVPPEARRGTGGPRPGPPARVDAVRPPSIETAS